MRRVIKACTWRIIAAATTATTAFIMTGSLRDAGTIAAWAGAVKIVLYIWHDKMWDKVPDTVPTPTLTAI